MNKYITIHCAATPNGRPTDITDIDRWHKERNFKRRPEWVARFNPDLKHVGYHYFIKLNGEVQTGRHTDELGAHVKDANMDNIGICLAGTDKYTKQQWDALKLLVADLMSSYPIVAVKGHEDWPSGKAQGKTCPNFDVGKWFATKIPEDKNIL